MNWIMNWLENSFAPRATKINTNVWIAALKDSIMQALPMVFLGSLFAMLGILNEFVPWLPSFWAPWGWTMGLISLFIAFLLPFNLMEKKRLRKNRITAGMAGLALFLIIISPTVIADGQPGFSHGALGAGGMFVAIIAGLFVGLIMSWFGKFSFFKETSVIPEFVRAWFDSMLPIGIVVIIGWLLVQVAGVNIMGLIQTALSPLQYGMQSLGGFILVVFVQVFIYSMGISTWVLTPIIMPALYAATIANMTGGADNLVTYETMFTAYLFIGGTGTTLPLVLMMLRSRAREVKALGRACLPPSIFNINEPIVFGAIAWNPTLMIPMWINGIVLPFVIWFFTRVIPLAPIPARQFNLWYTPFPLSTWLSVPSVRALLMFAIVFAISSAIWYPFYKSYERQELGKEIAENEKKAKKGHKHRHAVTEPALVAEPALVGAPVGVVESVTVIDPVTPSENVIVEEVR